MGLNLILLKLEGIYSQNYQEILEFIQLTIFEINPIHFYLTYRHFLLYKPAFAVLILHLISFLLYLSSFTSYIFHRLSGN